jgi:diguanylate cyclase (GGDEF)-like protein/PAS domain S-box-containing protein
MATRPTDLLFWGGIYVYHCIANISILSDTHDLERWLQQLPVPDRFEYRFYTYNVLSVAVLAESDIIIYDLPYSSSASQLQFRPVKKDAMFILCVPPEVLKELPADEYALFDDIWSKPLHQNLAVFYFSKTMAQYKRKQDLQLSQKYLDGLIDGIPDMVWFKDLSGAHLKVNNSFCQAVGKSKEDIAGKYHYYIWDIPKEEYEAGDYVCLDTDEIVLREKKTCLFHEKVKIKNSMRQLITYKSLIFSDTGEPMGTVGIARDVTDWVNMKSELEVILEHLPFSLLFQNISGIVLSVNNAFEKYFSVQRSAIVGIEYEKWAASVFLDYRETAHDNCSEATILADSEVKIVEILREPVYDVFNNITGHFYSFSDVTLERRMQEKLIHSANTDYLTALYNRRYLYEISSHLRSKHKLCLLCIDLDNFKILNDRYGHTEGDRTLIMVARNLSEQFSGQMIFRLGGDEFLVAVAQGYSEHMVTKQAKMFLDCFNDKTRFPYSSIKLSASIGIVFDTDPSIDFDEILRRGDTALYKAKQNGKNQYYIWSV